LKFSTPLKEAPPISLAVKFSLFYRPKVRTIAIEASVIPTIYAATYNNILGNEIILDVHNPKETKGLKLPPLVSIQQKMSRPKIKLYDSAI